MIREGYSSAFPCDSSWTPRRPLSAVLGALSEELAQCFYSFTPIPMSSTKNTPIFHAFHVKDGFFTKIGAAWKTKSGNGLSVVLDLLPPDGRFILAQPKSDKQTPSADSAEV